MLESTVNSYAARKVRRLRSCVGLKGLKYETFEEKNTRTEASLACTQQGSRHTSSSKTFSTLLEHVYAQCIDDTVGKTLVAVCTTSKELAGEKILPNVAGSQVLGTKLGEKMKAAGIAAAVFDRGSRKYHGCVKAFADAVRATGINF